MLTLRTNNGVTGFAPGQVVAGVAGWQLDEAPGDARLRLFWYTDGRGTQDITIVTETELPQGRTQYEQPFQFTLPPAPYSFTGALITLHWAIELVLDNGQHNERLELVVSPWTEMPKLASIEQK